MTGPNEAIEPALRSALHEAAEQIDVRPATLTTTDEPLVRRRFTRRSPVAAAVAACLAVALVIGGWFLLSRRDDPPSVQTPAGVPTTTVPTGGSARGCAGQVYVGNRTDGTVSVITTATGVVSPRSPSAAIRSPWRSLPTASTRT